MIITYNKTYRQEAEYDHFIVRGYPSNATNVFYEYWDLIKEHSNSTKEEIAKIVKEFKPKSKSNLSIYYTEDRIEFTKPNKVIFPVFFIEFKKTKEELARIACLIDEVGQFDPNPTRWQDRNCSKVIQSILEDDKIGGISTNHLFDFSARNTPSKPWNMKINKKLID